MYQGSLWQRWCLLWTDLLHGLINSFGLQTNINLNWRLLRNVIHAKSVSVETWGEAQLPYSNFWALYIETFAPFQVEGFVRRKDWQEKGIAHGNWLSVNTGGQSKVNATPPGSEELWLSSSAKPRGLEGLRSGSQGTGWFPQRVSRGRASFLGAQEWSGGSPMHADRNYSSWGGSAEELTRM